MPSKVGANFGINSDESKKMFGLILKLAEILEYRKRFKFRNEY